MSDPAETSKPPSERKEESGQQDSNVANRVASRIRFQPTGRTERRPTGAVTLRTVPASLPQPVSAVEDEAEEEVSQESLKIPVSLRLLFYFTRLLLTLGI